MEHIKIEQVGFDPYYFYFCVGNILYRIKKEYLIKYKKIKDGKISKRAKDYNRKLREYIYQIPDDLYKETHIYVVKKDGYLYDIGLRHPNFTRGRRNPNRSIGITFRQAKDIHDQRSQLSRERDESQTNQNVLEYPTKSWAKYPNKSDIKYIDTKREKV